VGNGSSRRAGFHLAFEPERRSQRASRALNWENHSVKTTNTAGHLDLPLVTHIGHAIFTVLAMVFGVIN